MPVDHSAVVDDSIDGTADYRRPACVIESKMRFGQVAAPCFDTLRKFGLPPLSLAGDLHHSLLSLDVIFGADKTEYLVNVRPEDELPDDLTAEETS
ncbi:hypothetical protein HG531_010787 [Fusarium graminearum]|nr:hypothetical protein HG531_010787 [Fusarium graminearum]